MATKRPSLLIRLGLDDKAALRELKNLRRQFKRSATEINSSLELVQKGSRMIGGALAGVGRVLASATQATAKYQRATAEVVTIANKAEFPLSKIKDITKDLGKIYGGPISDQAKALYQAISSGATDSKTAISLLSVANELSIGGLTSLSSSIDMLTSVVNVYGAATTDARDVSDAFFLAIREGKTDAEQLSAVIGSIAPVAKSVGVSYAELLSALAAITSQGVSTSEAATSLIGVFSALQKQTAKSQKEAKRLGIEFSVAALRAKGLSKFLSEIVDNSRRTDTTLVTLLGRVEALKSVLALTNEGGAKFNSTLAAMENRAGLTGDAFATMADTFSERMKMTAGLFDQAKIALGEYIVENDDFKDLLDDIDRALKGIVDRIRDDGPEIRATVSAFVVGVREIADTIKNNQSEIKLLIKLFVAAKLAGGFGLMALGMKGLGGSMLARVAVGGGSAALGAGMGGPAGLALGAMLYAGMGMKARLASSRQRELEERARGPGGIPAVERTVPTIADLFPATARPSGDMVFATGSSITAKNKQTRDKEAKAAATARRREREKRAAEIAKWRSDENVARRKFRSETMTSELIANREETDQLNALNEERRKALAAGHGALADALAARAFEMENGLGQLDKTLDKEIAMLRKHAKSVDGVQRQIGQMVASTMANTIGKMVEAMASGEEDLRGVLGRMVGGLMQNMGMMLIQLGTAGVLAGALGKAIPVFRLLTGAELGIAAGLGAIAAGGVMVAAGSAMSGASAPASTPRPATGGGAAPSGRLPGMGNVGDLPRGFVSAGGARPINNVINVTFGRGVVFGTPTQIARAIGDLADDRNRLRLGTAGA